MPLTEQRKMSYDEWLAEAVRRFGPNPLDFAWVCPNCGDVAALKDFPPQMRGRAGQECLGRVMTEVSTDTQWSGRGCNWAAYGLIPGPWQIEREGNVIRTFALADREAQ